MKLSIATTLYKISALPRGVLSPHGCRDGIHWARKQKPLGIDVSADGWDSQMICYAHPLFHDGRRCAPHNGNSYGEAGVGLVVFDSE